MTLLALPDSPPFSLSPFFFPLSPALSLFLAPFFLMPPPLLTAYMSTLQVKFGLLEISALSPISSVMVPGHNTPLVPDWA